MRQSHHDLPICCKVSLGSGLNRLPSQGTDRGVRLSEMVPTQAEKFVDGRSRRELLGSLSAHDLATEEGTLRSFKFLGLQPVATNLIDLVE